MQFKTISAHSGLLHAPLLHNFEKQSQNCNNSSFPGFSCLCIHCWEGFYDYVFNARCSGITKSTLKPAPRRGAFIILHWSEWRGAKSGWGAHSSLITIFLITIISVLYKTWSALIIPFTQTKLPVSIVYETINFHITTIC